MNKMRLSVVCVIAYMLLCCVETHSISMRVKKVIYDYISSLKALNTAHIACEPIPKDVKPSRCCIINPTTSVPEVRISSAYLLSNDIIYLEKELIDQIRKDFTLSSQIQNTLAYRAALIHIAQEKNSERFPLGQLARFFGMVFFLELGLLSRMDGHTQNAKQFTAIGLVLGAITTFVHVTTKRKHQQLPQEQDVLDTQEKARELARSIVEQVEQMA
jgi:hypothetical protein